MNDFINASRSLGRNIAYIQGAGGNSSFKKGGELFIKASGYLMKDMRKDFGIACCEMESITAFLNKKKQFRHRDDEEYGEIVKESIIQDRSFGLPSMETGMHVVIPSTYVFHLHSVYTNIFSCMKYGERTLKKIFPVMEFDVIDFFNPGYQLAYILSKKNKTPPIQFLKNHGLVVHGDSLDGCLNRISEIHKRIRHYLMKKGIYSEFEVKTESKSLKKHLFPDSIVFGSIDPSTLSGQKRESYLEIMSASQYILEMIKKLGGTPTFIDKEYVDRILNMGQEQHRLKVFHA